MTVHAVKCWPQYFAAIKSGAKTFDVRKDDRGYQVGDTLRLNEYNILTHELGEILDKEITYILRDDFEGVRYGYVVLALK